MTPEYSHWRLCVLAAIAVTLISCERVPLTSPTGSTISITVEQSTIPINGQSAVRAIVTESSGTPVHNGTQVNFTSALGSFNPPTATTSGGVATTTFLAGTLSGTTRINAYSGGATTNTSTGEGGVEVRIGAAAAGALSVNAVPSSVSQSGGTVTVIALVLDAANNPLPGVSVLFTTSTGSLSAPTALSDSSGIARVQLTTVQTATVTAIAGAAKGDTTITVSAAPAITITAADSGTEGVPVPITITFTAPSTGAAPQVQSLTVDFGDGRSETRNNVTGSTGFSHTYTRPAGYTITATARDVNGNTGISSKAITINAAALPTVGLSANPNPVPANNLTTITVTASAGGSAPLRSVTVHDVTSGGGPIYSGTGGGSFAHRFGTAGTYTLRATATDANGSAGTTTTVVVVQ